MDLYHQHHIFFSLTANNDYTFTGDRVKEEILNFAIRLAGPPVQPITTPESLAQYMNYNKLFFIYVGPPEGLLWEAYFSAATKMQQHSFFYSVEENVSREHLDNIHVPVILVHNENATFPFLGMCTSLIFGYNCNSISDCISNWGCMYWDLQKHKRLKNY